jgi:hypothetical protein
MFLTGMVQPIILFFRGKLQKARNTKSRSGKT